ncbi:MAG: hypothetical protein IJ301_04960, partial [Clostridia bacterium]|nr:hypothetical protein [Clostridia bacterium]
DATGGLAGYVASGTCTITNCDVYADSTSTYQIRAGSSSYNGYAGGFIGYSAGTSVSITDSAFYSSGGNYSVYGYKHAGGLIGYHNPSSSTATLTLTNNLVELGASYSVYSADSSSGSGGLVGNVRYNINVSGCTVNCNTTYAIGGSTSSYDYSYIGGIVGYAFDSSSNFNNCTVNFNEKYSLKGNSAVGGIIGYNTVGININNSEVNIGPYEYVIYAYDGSAGGMVGNGKNISINECEVNIENASNHSIYGLEETGGVIGYCTDVITLKNNIVNCNGRIYSSERTAGGFGGSITSSGEISNNKIYLKSARSISCGSEGSSIGGFMGTYSGTATIYDNLVSIDGGTSSYAALYNSSDSGLMGGFIGSCTSNITQKNTVLINSAYPFYMIYDSTYKTKLGFYIGYANGYKISNAVVEGTVSTINISKPYMLGGVVGYDAVVDNCRVNNVHLVSQSVYFGGLVGSQGSGTNSYIINSSINVTSSSAGASIGGLCGASDSTFENCYADIDITSTSSGYDVSIGGFSPVSNSYTYKNCQFVGSIVASATYECNYSFYGFAGAGSAINCGIIMDITTSSNYITESLYSTFSTVTAVTNCYVKIANTLNGVSATSTTSAAIAYDISGTYSGSKNADKMKDLNYYLGLSWDFESLWYIDTVNNENDGYPTLFHDNFVPKAEAGVTLNSFSDTTITATLGDGLSPIITIRDFSIRITRSGSGSSKYCDYSYSISGTTLTLNISNVNYTGYLGHCIKLSSYKALAVQNNLNSLRMDSFTQTAQGSAVIVATILSGDIYPTISLNTYSAQPITWGSGTRSGTFGNTTYTYTLNNNVLNLSISNLPAGENMLYINETYTDVNVYFSSGSGSIYKINSGFNTTIMITPDGGKYVSSIKVGSAGENQLIDKTSGYILADGVFSIDYSARSGVNTIILECISLKKTIDIYITVADMQNEIKESGGASITGVAVQATNGGEVRMTGSDFAEDADEIVLMAVAYAGYQFEKWTDSEGNNLGSALSVRFTKAQIDGKIIIANFEKIANDKVNTETDNTGEFV